VVLKPSLMDADDSRTFLVAAIKLGYSTVTVSIGVQ